MTSKRLTLPETPTTTQQKTKTHTLRKTQGESIRKTVSAWRDNDYEGTTSVTRRLLWHWTDPQATRLRFLSEVQCL